MPQEGSEPLNFGLERELTYAGHLTPAAQLVPLVKRTFASADETHIRVWGPAGDLAKFAFPSNRRSMVSAMTFCPNFSTIVTGEVDMTLKCYSLSLDLVESFALEQARLALRGDKEKKSGRKASGKVTCLECLSTAGSFILAGSECGCELWQLTKSRERRINTSKLRGLEYHLQLNLVKQITTEPVYRIVCSAEQRVIVAGYKTLVVLDNELTLVASCNMPFVCSAHLHMLSSSQAEMMTGAASGAVHLWSIQAFDAPVGSAVSDGLCTRLEHTFYGHTRPVEMVCFYSRPEKAVAQRFAVSCGLDLRVQVWSLDSFVRIYTLDINLTDSKAHVFPISLHLFAVSYTVGGSTGDSQKGASVALIRFNAHLALPFATTTGSAVAQITQPPWYHQQIQPQRETAQAKQTEPLLANAAVLVSEDMAIRVYSAKSKALLSTLPPPPNSKVQVLEVFLCPVWQLLILWLSSEEVAIFYVPSAPLEKQSKAEDKVPRSRAATPLLLRRFGIVEVRTLMLDKDLSREAFCSVSIYYGPLPKGDALMHTVKVAQQVLADDSSPASPRRHMPRQTPPAGRDWYLLVGTRQGTLQAFSIAELLSDLPVWSRICGHLPKEATAVFSRRPRRTRTTGKLKVPEENDARLAEIEQEHIEAMELSRAAGQRPFPKQSQIPLFSRWRRHDYAIEAVKSVADRILTIDTERNLKVCRAEDSRCLFSFQLPDFSCLTPYLSCSQVNGRTGREEDFSLLGVTLGNSRGALELVELPLDSEEPEVLSSHASHGGAVLQVDFLLPAEIFVSVGEDDTLRFWSSSLYLLREVYFPQACTSVAFLQLPDMDTSHGHGDVLVGFAAHVEQIPLDVWARGVKHQGLGGTLLDSTLRSSQGTSKGTSKGTQFSKHAQEEDSMVLEELALMWEPPEAAPSNKEDLVPTVRLESLESEEVSSIPLPQEPEKVRTGMVMDFRGSPIIPLGVLSSGAADMTGVQERLEKRLVEPSLEHEHSKVLDQGDFQSVTRHYPGYYDWTVLPTDLIDAPRSYAIRGVTKDDNVAVVTSVGVGHLRSSKTGFNKRAEVPPSLVEEEEIAEEDETVEALEPAEAEEVDNCFNGTGQVEKPPPSRSSRPPVTAQGIQGPDTFAAQPQGPQVLACTRRPSSGMSPDQGDDSEEEQIEVEEEEVEEPWRNLRIARGVPKRADAPKPMVQNIGNTDADAARMLKEHGRLIDAPEDSYDSNFLTRVTAKKTDFVYCGVDNLNYARRPARRNFIPDSDIPDEGLKLWTATGRMRTGLRAPPQRALPRSYVPLPPPHLWERAPVTRSEVTEMKIIAAAQQPPIKDWAQDLILESAEANKARQQKLPAVRRGDTSRSGSSLTSDTQSSGVQFSKVSFALPKGGHS